MNLYPTPSLVVQEGRELKNCPVNLSRFMRSYFREAGLQGRAGEELRN